MSQGSKINVYINTCTHPGGFYSKINRPPGLNKHKNWYVSGLNKEEEGNKKLHVSGILRQTFS